MKVLLCWSGSRSKETAEALHDWLGETIQAVEPWMSPNMEKGVRWNSELADQFEKSKFGIFCLTKENLNAPWILFEVGALSKPKGAHVCTFLLELTPADIEPPLAQFEHTKFEKEDIRLLARTINQTLEKVGERALPEKTLDCVFDRYWPDLEEKLKTIADKAIEDSKLIRGDREILEEILEILRAQERRSYIHESAEKMADMRNKSWQFHPSGSSGIQGQQGEPNGGV